jgi:predicted RNase H-like nuclease
VLLRPDGPLQVLTAEAIGALVELARETAHLEVVAIDIPIGLPDSGRRQADVLARKALPGKTSSVFTTLTRASWAADTRDEAEEISRRTSGQGVPPYTFALRDKLLQVDAWVLTRPPVRVVEVHPELCFAEMTGTPVLSKKREPQGALDRRAALTAAGLTPPPFYAGSGFAEDDLLDACAAAWTAVRCATGTAHSLPAEPEVFSDGIPAAIWV